MTLDDFLGTGSNVVLGAQLVLPLLLGVPSLRTVLKDINRKREGAAASASAPDGAAMPAVAPLRCPSCDAPVPLAAAAFACPFCHAAIRPPDDYLRMLELREASRRELARAERLWRFSRFSSAPVVVWLLRIGVIVWTLMLLFAAAAQSERWPHMALMLVAVLAVLQIFLIMAEASVLVDMRATLPRLPARAALRLPAGNGDCPECGAPVHFDEERLATTCGYCGADAYRAALAGAARADAQASEQRSRKSLREAVADVRSRRVELAGLFALMAFAEIFYAVFFLLASGWDYLMG